MATSRACALSSDPDFLLSFMSELGEDSDSDDDFDGYLDEDDGPVAVRREEVPDSPGLYSPPGSPSYSPVHLGSAVAESPLPGPSHSPMQVADSPSLSPMHASSSPTLPTTQPHTSTLSALALEQLHPPQFSATPGVVPDMTGQPPIEFFRLFFDRQIFELLFMETRRFAQQYLEREREHLANHPKARAHEWSRYPLTRKEMEVFIALLIAMGICGFPTIR